MLFRGQTLGKYKIIAPLGSGGFGTVYLAQDTWIDKKVAIKVPHMTLDARSGFGYASAQVANMVVKFSMTDWRRVLEIPTDQTPDPIEIIQVEQTR